MSYHFRPDRFYRMPTHFGPSLGPRQGVDGRRYKNLTVKDTSVEATFSAPAAQLEALLPPGFTLRGSGAITFTFNYINNIEWLAGRGYNTFGVSVPATYQGKQDTANGNLLLVLWENMADPIITGREDLGFSKIYCELPELQCVGDKVICRASWDGCQFASLQLTGLNEVSPHTLPEAPPSDGTLHYKYIPKTSAPGEADVGYVALTPADWPNVKVNQIKLAESANCHFRQSSWEELPTLVHIVNTLAALELGDCIDASLCHSQGGKDLSDQRILV